MRQVNWLDRSGKAAGLALAADTSVPNYPEFSADGTRFLLNRTVENNTDVWSADLSRGGLTRFTFDSALSGQFEIVVQTFPQSTGKWQVSRRGGIQPRWRADGKELYFVGSDGMLMAVSVTIAGSTFSAGTPVPLFAAHLAPGAGANKHNYAVARDGRFLIVQPVESAPAPITLILNWRPK